MYVIWHIISPISLNVHYSITLFIHCDMFMVILILWILCHSH